MLGMPTSHTDELLTAKRREASVDSPRGVKQGGTFMENPGNSSVEVEEVKEEKEYTVTLSNVAYYTVEVTATSEEDAWEQAEELACAGETDDWDRDWDGLEVYGVEESC